LIIIILGVKHIGSTNLLAFETGFSGVLKATALVFFAFIGFESIVKLSEETKNPNKTIPKALLLSIFITTIVYVLVAISAVSIISYEKLSLSKAPLAEVASVSLGSFGNIAFFVLAIIALFSTLNTVLLSLVTSSRLTYGLADQKAIPEKFGEIHPKTRTPWLAIFLIGILSLVFVFFESIEIVANITNISIFLTFAFVNASLLVLRYKINPNRVKFKIKFLNIGKFSVIALLGLITSLVMLVYSIVNIILA
jgi:APA family basic amino acid/polyamine antiporter